MVQNGELSVLYAKYLFSDPDFSTVALNCSHDMVLHPVLWEGTPVV
jgi:hypothetical protein